MSKIPLNEFITLQRGFDLPSSKRISGNVPVVASTGIAGYHNEIKVKAPGVVIGRSGSIGGGQYIEEDFFPLNTTLYVKDFKGHYPRFIYYLLKSIDFTSFNVGTGVPTLNRNHLSSILISNLGIEKEKEIAGILGSLDQKIQLNTQINQTLEQIAQAIFKSWFVDFDPVRAKAAALESGKTQAEAELAAMQAISGKTAEELAQMSSESYAELAEIAKAFPSEFGEDGVPMGWQYQYLKDVCNIVYGKGLPKTKLTTKGYKVFGANGVIGFYSEFMYEKPQVLIGCRGTVGQVTVSYPFSFITNNSLIIEYENSLVNRYYLENYLRTLNLKEISSGSVQPQITIQNMSGVKILMPFHKIMNIYKSYIEAIYDKKYQIYLENESLFRLIDVLLPKLLNGKM